MQDVLRINQRDLAKKVGERLRTGWLPRGALPVALLLYALYWLTASGSFHSIDEHAVFAVSRNLVLHGQVNQNALFWDDPYLFQAQQGLDGAVYSKYGIGHSLLVALPVAVARLLPGVELVPAAMVLNGLATALTGALLVVAAARLGYTPRSGIILALLFGAGTFAWVYARTMFSEPLVGLGWMAAVALLAQGGSRRQALLVGIVLAVTVTVRPASILLVPLFALPLWDSRPRVLASRLVSFGAPVAIAMVGLLGLNAARFGNPLDFGYAETFDGSLVAGLSGFLLSLDRSLFLFAPPLVALAWSAPAFLRKHRLLGVTMGMVALISLLMYSTWPVFWGGPVWGPRYLLPVVPLLVLMLAPAVEAAWQPGGWRRWALVTLAVLGVLMQLPGVIWNSLPATQELGQRYPLWTLPPQGEWLDVAWFYARPEGTLIAFLMAVAATVLFSRPSRVVAGVALAGSALATVILLGWLSEASPGFEQRPAYDTVLARLQEERWEGDALLLNPAPYQAPLPQLIWFLNRSEMTVPVYGVYREPSEPTNSTQYDYLLERHGRLWLLTEGVAPGDPDSTAEHALVQRAFHGGTEWLEEGFRLTRFESAGVVLETGEPYAVLGDRVSLEKWSVARGAMDRSLQILLRWRVHAPPEQTLRTFAQALDEPGQLVAGWDGVPQGEFAPTTAWQAGDVVEERLALHVPLEQGGPLRLVAGLYDEATGQRLLTPGGADLIELNVIGWPPVEERGWTAREASR